MPGQPRQMAQRCRGLFGIRQQHIPRQDFNRLTGQRKQHRITRFGQKDDLAIGRIDQHPVERLAMVIGPDKATGGGQHHLERVVFCPQIARRRTRRTGVQHRATGNKGQTKPRRRPDFCAVCADLMHPGAERFDQRKRRQIAFRRHIRQHPDAHLRPQPRGGIGRSKGAFLKLAVLDGADGVFDHLQPGQINPPRSRGRRQNIGRQELAQPIGLLQRGDGGIDQQRPPAQNKRAGLQRDLIGGKRGSTGGDDGDGRRRKQLQPIVRAARRAQQGAHQRFQPVIQHIKGGVEIGIGQDPAGLRPDTGIPLFGSVEISGNIALHSLSSIGETPCSTMYCGV